MEMYIYNINYYCVGVYCTHEIEGVLEHYRHNRRVYHMLSFRNANPGDLDVNRRSRKNGDLYINQRVSENRGFIRKSGSLGKSGTCM